MKPISWAHPENFVLFQNAMPATSRIPAMKKHTDWKCLLTPIVCTTNCPKVSSAQISPQAPTAPMKFLTTISSLPAVMSAVSMKSHCRSTASRVAAIEVRKRVNLEVSWQRITYSASRTLATAQRIQSAAAQQLPKATYAPMTPRKSTTKQQMTSCGFSLGRGQMGKAS